MQKLITDEHSSLLFQSLCRKFYKNGISRIKELQGGHTLKSRFNSYARYEKDGFCNQSHNLIKLFSLSFPLHTNKLACLYLGRHPSMAHTSGVPFLSWYQRIAVAYLADIRLGCKSSPEINTLAYFSKAFVESYRMR